MGYWNSGWFGKFYSEQVTRIVSLLERYTREADSVIDIDKYYAVCEQLGQEPDPDKLPIEISAFPVEVQSALYIYDLLSDRWDGMSGSYLGKEWSSVNFLLDTYDVVDERKEIVYFCKVYENIKVRYTAEKAERRRKAEERKSQAAGGGGKNFAHNVTG